MEPVFHWISIEAIPMPVHVFAREAVDSAAAVEHSGDCHETGNE